MTKYVYGTEGQLRCKDTPPGLWQDPKNKRSMASWPGGGTFVVERGVLAEHRSMDGRHVYARVVGGREEIDLIEIDKRIQAVQDQLRELDRQRQEILMMAATRGARIKSADLEPIPVKDES